MSLGDRLDPGRLYGRGFAFPLRLDGAGRIAWSDGEENVRESIRVILATEPRERRLLPEFGAGLGRFLFRPNTTATRRLIEEAIRRALGRFEPRIEVLSVDVEADPDEPEAALVTLRYRLVATGLDEQLGLVLRFTP
ncbi:MAG: GPW/gp25 family protein [Holophagales bacterium]|nr:GPW/gp25 family protein [Holophagales bacterium]